MRKKALIVGGLALGLTATVLGGRKLLRARKHQ